MAYLDQFGVPSDVSQSLGMSPPFLQSRDEAVSKLASQRANKWRQALAAFGTGLSASLTQPTGAGAFVAGLGGGLQGGERYASQEDERQFVRSRQALADQISAREAANREATLAETTRHNVATENIRETPKPPESPFGKLPDFANPALTKEQRDALYRKATYIAPPSTENTIDTSTIDKRTLRMLGQQYRMGGPQSVPRVTGRDSAKWMAAIVKEAANPTPLSPGEAPMPPIMASAADYQANLASYKETSKRYHNISAFENTALANSEKVVIPLLDKIPDTGNQIGNQVMRTGASIFGHGQVPAFQAARQSVLAEFSRLLQTANASGIITDTARKELEAGIGPNFTKQQMINALDTLRAEAHNRRVATANELTDIRNLIGFDPASGLPNPNDNLANPANPQSATTAAPDVVWKLVNGKLVKE